MKSIHRKLTEFFIEIAITAVVVSLFLVFMPMLNQIERSYRDSSYENRILLTVHKPPEPPDIDKMEKSREKQLKKVKKTQTQKSKRKSKPTLDIPRFDFALGGDLAGGIQIAPPAEQDNLMSGLFRTAFKLSEVDQPPRCIRRIIPIYPYLAKRKSITGKVVVRIIVDKKGRMIESTIDKAEPPGVFEDAALNTIKRWRFKPAIKDGKAVNVIVVIPLVFELET